MKIEIDANDFCIQDCKYLDVDKDTLYCDGEVRRRTHCRNKEICANAVQLRERNGKTSYKNFEKLFCEAQEKLKYVVEENEMLERRLKHLLQSRYIQSFDQCEPFTGEKINNILDADSLMHFLKWRFKKQK